MLYKMALAESPSYRTLVDAVQKVPELRASLSLLVADNSPEPQEPPPDFRGIYLHDGANPGLASRYNAALNAALDSGAQWLLLFDHDTTLTPEYMAEMLALSRELAASPEVAIIVPKLMMDGRLLSPHTPRFRFTRQEPDTGTTGLFAEPLRAFNSGALLRVSALQAAGGFPEEYWLDYLDHATFHRIQAQGGRLYVMQSALQHELSDARVGVPQNPVRLLNRLRAEERFYTEHTSWHEHLFHRFDLLRQVVGWGRRGHFDQAMIRLRILLHRD